MHKYSCVYYLGGSTSLPLLSSRCIVGCFFLSDWWMLAMQRARILSKVGDSTMWIEVASGEWICDWKLKALKVLGWIKQTGNTRTMVWLPALWRDIIVETARGVGVGVKGRQEQSCYCFHGLFHMLILIGEAVIVSSKKLSHHVDFHGWRRWSVGSLHFSNVGEFKARRG